MALLSTFRSPIFSSNKTHKTSLPNFSLPNVALISPSLPLPFLSSSNPRKCFSFLPHSSLSGSTPDSDSDPDPESATGFPASVTDEWGEKCEPESEPESGYAKVLDSDPPVEEDEWGEDGSGGGAQEFADVGNGTAAAQGKGKVEDYDKLGELKRCLADTVYGTDFGFRAGAMVRGEVLELVNQLEAENPTPAPVEAPGLLDGNWVLLYTSFSELLPLLAVGTIPLLKVDKICQSIDTSSFAIVNSITLSSPFATFSFSASATFEVRSASRIQVEFKEGTLQPPEIKSSIDLPENVDIFGQKINLSPVQQSTGPLQEAVARISRTISGQPPLKIPIPGGRTKSWLLTTYLDEDLRISRGDGGLFVLAKEGSPLLDQ